MLAPTFLLFLATFTALATATVAAVFLFRGRGLIARRLVRALAGAATLYSATIIGVALTSDRTIIALGGEKHICEIDCHIAYSVLGVEKAALLGSGTSQAKAAGEFYIVTVRTRFDAATTSSRRPQDLLLNPGPRTIALLDENGRSYPVSAAGQTAIAQPAPSDDMLSRPLLPGEEYTTKLAFDVPQGVSQPMLLIRDADFTKWLLLGSETFPLHAKALFRLDAGPGVMNVSS